MRSHGYVRHGSMRCLFVGTCDEPVPMMWYLVTGDDSRWSRSGWTQRSVVETHSMGTYDCTGIFGYVIVSFRAWHNMNANESVLKKIHLVHPKYIPNIHKINNGLEQNPLQGPLSTITIVCLELHFVRAGSSKVHLGDHSTHQQLYV